MYDKLSRGAVTQCIGFSSTPIAVRWVEQTQTEEEGAVWLVCEECNEAK